MWVTFYDIDLNRFSTPQPGVHPGPIAAQTPEGVGRVIAALAVDPQLMSITGQTLHIADLARRYGVNVTD
jgi:hypothetical protein